MQELQRDNITFNTKKSIQQSHKGKNEKYCWQASEKPSSKFKKRKIMYRPNWETNSPATNYFDFVKVIDSVDLVSQSRDNQRIIGSYTSED